MKNQIACDGMLIVLATVVVGLLIPGPLETQFRTYLDRCADPIAATKFADTVLDSGTNQAMSLVQYGPPATRLPFAVELIQLLEKDDLGQWWKAFEKNDGEAFSEMMKIPLERLELLHKEKVYDDRTVQLLRDALTWGMAHPEQLLEGGYVPLHAPNVVAITLIVDMLHTLHEQTGARVVKFIHDEQNQFIKHLKLMHDHSKQFQLDTSNVCNPLPVVRGALTFDYNLGRWKAKELTRRLCCHLNLLTTPVSCSIKVLMISRS